MKPVIEKYNYTYLCTPNNIDINTLLLSQLHFVEIINEIQKKIHPDYQFKIKVEAPKDGSFEFHQVYECIENSGGLFSRQNIEYAANFTEVMGAIFAVFFTICKIRKHLKGKRAKEIKEKEDVYEVTNTEGVSLSFEKRIFNLYQNNDKINIEINNHFNVINNDGHINGLNIKSDNNKSIHQSISKEDFQDFITPNEYLSSETIEKQKEKERVLVKKVDLMPKNDKVLWSVIYNTSVEIKVRITDKDFINRINEGLKVAQGDSMVVNMNITAKLDKVYNEYIDQNYEIVKVIDYIERKSNPEKRSMFNNE